MAPTDAASLTQATTTITMCPSRSSMTGRTSLIGVSTTQSKTRVSQLPCSFSFFASSFPSTCSYWSASVLARVAMPVRLYASCFWPLVCMLSSLTAYGAMPRPNSKDLCGSDDNILVCAIDNALNISRRSFPSCQFVLLWHVHSGLDVARQGGTVRIRTISSFGGPCIDFPRLGLAFFIGASRVQDKWHHPADVIAGGCNRTCCCCSVCARVVASLCESIEKEGRMLLFVPFRIVVVDDDGGRKNRAHH